HIQILIEQVGFWDVGDHNLPEVRSDGQGVCGTDFENVDLDLATVSDGLERLAKMVPVSSLNEDILLALVKSYPKKAEVALAQHNKLYAQFPEFAPPPPTEMRLLNQFTLIYAEKQEGIKARISALQEYDRRGYTTGNEPIQERDLKEMTPEEKILAEELIA